MFLYLNIYIYSLSLWINLSIILLLSFNIMAPGVNMKFVFKDELAQVKFVSMHTGLSMWIFKGWYKPTCVLPPLDLLVYFPFAFPGFSSHCSAFLASLHVGLLSPAVHWSVLSLLAMFLLVGVTSSFVLLVNLQRNTNH